MRVYDRCVGVVDLNARVNRPSPTQDRVGEVEADIPRSETHDATVPVRVDGSEHSDVPVVEVEGGVVECQTFENVTAAVKVNGRSPTDVKA